MVGACLLHIIGYYFVRWSKSFILIISVEREDSSAFYNDVLDRTFANWKQYSLQIVNVHRGQKRRVRGTRDYNMVLIDSYESFVSADLVAHTKNNNHNEYYYIFLKRSDAMLWPVMQQIFEYCWQNHLINCVIQIQTDRGELQLYTYYPFTRWQCGKAQIVRITGLNASGKMSREMLFPSKLKNFYGCPLRVAIWHIPPFMSLSTDAEGNVQLDGGCESRLLKMLSDRYNFSLDLRVFDDDTRGNVFPNGSTTGVLKMLNDRELDFGIGSYHQNALRNSVATSTVNYYQSIISVVMLRSALRLSDSKALIYPFQPNTWLILFVVTIAVILGVYIFRHIRHTTVVKPFTDVFISMLGMPFVHMPPFKELRVFALSWIFFTLIIRSAYLGFLFHIIRSHLLSNPPTDLNTLISRNFGIIVSERVNHIIANISELKQLNHTILQKKPETYTLEYLLNLPPEEGNHVMGISAVDFLQYQIRARRLRDVVKIMPYDLLGFKICIYLAKHSYLSDQFNELLIWVRDSGLIEYWKKTQLDSGYVNGKWQAEDELFDMAELKTAFMAVGIGDVIAILIFLVEVFYHKYFDHDDDNDVLVFIN
uniref:Uncharacterized protein n=1 Tax=Musca domestica TaxID=7370 RepID=A0A1I8MKQ0_MUSDO